MTEQTQLPRPQKAKRSALYRQRRAAIIGLGVVLLLTVAFIIVWSITSRTVFEDFDGAKYYVKQKDGAFVLLDADSNPVSTNENGNYVTKANTIISVESATGNYKIIAAVPTEGTERLEYDYYSGEFDVLMYPKLSRDEIESIQVVNEKDSYKFIRNKDGTYRLENYPGIGFSDTMFGTLVNLTGYTVTLDRLDLSDPDVAYGFAENGYGEYGLPENPDDAKNYYVLTTRDGTVHKVIIGDEIPSAAGYYVRYVGRDSVYIMKSLTESEQNSTFSQTLLGTLEDFVVPYAVVPMTSTSYFDVTNFTLYRVPENFQESGKLEQIIRFSYEPIENRKGSFYANFPYVADGDLGGYKIHSYNADDCLQNLQYLSPLRTVQINRPDKPLDEGIFARTYGIAYAIEFTYNDKRDSNQNVAEGDKYPQTIWISPRTKNDTYFVFATYFDMVVEVARSDFEFLEWTPFEWISDSIFNANIFYCTDLTVESKVPTAVGATGVTSAHFRLDNSASKQENDTSMNVDDLRVYADLVKDGTSITGEETNALLFKKFYQTLLYSSLQGNASLTEEEMEAYRASGDAGADMIIRIVYVVNGKKIEDVCRFYHIENSSRQTFMTLNGKGSFYMLHSRVDKIFNDFGRMLTNDADTVIDPQAKT